MTEAVHPISRAQVYQSAPGINANYQWGESQQENSWKAARTVDEAEVHGLVANDCQGENSDDVYRKQMGQNRDGYANEVLVSNADCAINHKTFK